MKYRSHSLALGSILAGAFLSLDAHAQFNVSADNFVPTLFRPEPGWHSGHVTLPSGTRISSTPLELDLTLSHNLTINNAVLGHEDYGFAMFGLDPAIQPNGSVFSFVIELLENGVLQTPSFATDIANGYAFGFQLTNPFSTAESNLQLTTSTTILNPGITFNQIAILVSNSNPGGEAVNNFDVLLGVVPAPEPGTLALCALGFLGMITLRFRKVRV